MGDWAGQRVVEWPSSKRFFAPTDLKERPPATEFSIRTGLDWDSRGSRLVSRNIGPLHNPSLNPRQARRPLKRFAESRGAERRANGLREGATKSARPNRREPVQLACSTSSGASLPIRSSGGIG